MRRSVEIENNGAQTDESVGARLFRSAPSVADYMDGISLDSLNASIHEHIEFRKAV